MVFADANTGGKRPDAEAIGRRGFLQWVSVISGAIGATLIGLPVVRSFISPILPKPEPDSWVKVADDIATLDVGVPIRLNFVMTRQDAWLESRALNGVWLFTEDGKKFKAFNGHCTHLGCGFVLDKDGKNFLCPCHRGIFDIRTGAVLNGPPPRPLDELPVEIREGAVYVKYSEFRLGVVEKREA